MVISSTNNGADAEVLHVRSNNNTYNGGTSHLLVRGDGNVGIGTTSPDAKLVIEDSTSDVVTQYRANNNYAGQIIGKASGIFSLNGRLGLDFNFTGNQTSAMRIASNGNVGIGTASPAAPLEVSSTTGGVIMPRMTTTERNAIASPTNGEMVYDTVLNKFYGYANNAWTALH